MAILIPAVLDQDAPVSEKIVASLLSNLTAGWTAYHSVAWMHKEGTKTNQGEADFVLAHRDYGVLVLEVKGGIIELTDGKWTSTPKGSNLKNPIKNPLDQANRNKFAIAKKLSLATNIQSFKIGQAVFFPASIFQSPASVSIEQKQIFDLRDAKEAKNFELRLIDSMKSQDVMKAYSEEVWAKIHKSLSPTVELSSMIRIGIDWAKKSQEIESSRMLQLTQEQIKVLRSLSSNPRLGITGPAGTGKTLLAMEQAARFSQSGKVLFISGTQRMVEIVQENLKHRGASILQFSDIGPGVVTIDVNNLVSKIREEAQWNSTEIDLPKKKGNQRKAWRLARDFELCMPLLKSKFDAIILDEAQEMRPEILKDLSLLLIHPDESPFLIFFDPKQSFYRNWKLPFEAQLLVLSKNCRNTFAIQNTYSSIVPVSAESISDFDELSVSFIVSSGLEDAMIKLRETVQAIMLDGVTLDQIAVLVMRDFGLVRKNIRTHVESLKRKFAPIHTISGFKGQESDVVVLYLNENFEGRDWSRRFYEGVSRAKARLFIIGEDREIEAAVSLGYLEK